MRKRLPPSREAFGASRLVLLLARRAGHMLLTSSQWFVFVASTLTAVFIYALDNTITADIVPVRCRHSIHAHHPRAADMLPIGYRE